MYDFVSSPIGLIGLESLKRSLPPFLTLRREGAEIGDEEIL